MHPSVVKDIKNVLKTAHSAIKKKNYFALEGLSNRLNHSITIYQEKTISQCSVAVFALSKIFDKEEYLQHSDFKHFRDETLAYLKTAQSALSKNPGVYLHNIKMLLSEIEKFSGKLKLYHEPLLSYACSVKAKHAVEHGLSTSQASKLFGIPEWSMSKQIGKSVASEKHYAQPKFNKQRIELVKRLFNIK